MDVMNEPINLSKKKKKPIAIVAPSNYICTYKSSTSSQLKSNLIHDRHQNIENVVEKHVLENKQATNILGNKKFNNISSKLNSPWDKYVDCDNNLTNITNSSTITPCLNLLAQKQALEAAHNHLEKYITLTNQYLESQKLIGKYFIPQLDATKKLVNI